MAIKTVITTGPMTDGPSNGPVEVTIKGTRGRDANQGKIVRDEAGIKRVQEALGMDKGAQSGTMNNDTTLNLQRRLTEITGSNKLNQGALDALSRSTNPQDQALGHALSQVKPGVLDQSYRPLKMDEVQITSKPVEQTQGELDRRAEEQHQDQDHKAEVQAEREAPAVTTATAAPPATDARTGILSDLSPEQVEYYRSPAVVDAMAGQIKDGMEAHLREYQKQNNLPETGKFDIDTHTAMASSKDPAVQAELTDLVKSQEAGRLDQDGSVNMDNMKQFIRDQIRPPDGAEVAQSGPQTLDSTPSGQATYVHPVAAYEQQPDGSYREAATYNGGAKVGDYGYDAGQPATPPVNMDDVETARRFQELMSNGVVGSVGSINPDQTVAQTGVSLDKDQPKIQNPTMGMA